MKTLRPNRTAAMIVATIVILLAYAFFAWLERQRGHDWTADPPRIGPAPAAR